MTEEAQQRIREIETQKHHLQQQVQQLQEQVSSVVFHHPCAWLLVCSHSQLMGWVVRSEEVEMTTEELGRGAWGVVNVAKFRGLKVAAKCLHQVIISCYNNQRFTLEISIAAKLRHPNLLLFIGAATREGELMILTELMPTSLDKELQKRADQSAGDLHWSRCVLWSELHAPMETTPHHPP